MYNTYISFPHINPIIFSVFSISIRWYGFMYFLGFIFAVWRGNVQAKYYNLTKIEVDNLLYSCFFGLFIGGRIGYVMFYNPMFFSQNVLCILKVWEGGMSFHGGLLGILVVLLYFSKKLNKKFLDLSDFVAPLVPFGLGLGRLGNFINGELWGRIAPNCPFSILFPSSKLLDLELSKDNIQFQHLINKFGVLPRHPSQIYECILEGVLLFFILNFFTKKNFSSGFVSGLFLILYGIFRIFSEFFRQPDPQIGFYLNIFSMGQILSVPMIVFGFFIWLNIFYHKVILNLDMYGKLYQFVKKNIKRWKC
ncbi:MAG: prolipoprotein diacylglyceryl transferase [Buchnera aphidicola (Chaetogeoica yunlongensis)]